MHADRALVFDEQHQQTIVSFFIAYAPPFKMRLREGKNIRIADGIDGHHGYLRTGIVFKGSEQIINLRRCIGVYEAIRV